MPPKRIEVQRVIDPITSNDPEKETSDARVPKKRKDTRARHGERLRRDVETNGKVSVTFRKIEGQPLGPNASQFKTELGVAVKKFAPLQVNSWRKISKEQKQPIYDRLMEMFIVDLGTGPESVRDEVEVMMSRTYSSQRARMHSYYKTIVHLPWDDRVKQMPENSCDSQEDWEYLCRLFETDKYKRCSSRNSINRAAMPYNHRAGSRSFLQHCYDGSDEPSKKNDRITLFQNTHYNNEKGWIGERADSVYHDMVQLREEIHESENTTADSSHTLNDIEIADRVCDQVLGRRPGGYMRGLGNGPKLPSISSGASSSKSTNAQLKEELVRIQAKLQSTETKMQTLESKLEAVFQAFESLAPGVMQSFLQHHSSPLASPPSSMNSKS